MSKVSTSNLARRRCWHVCGECRRKVYVSRAQGWRRAQPRCMACGSGRLLTPGEARLASVLE